jgi:tetratricopeptide (TPR) repeat protein
MGDTAVAQEYFSKAYALGPQFQELAAYAAAGYFAAGQPSKADQILLASYGTTAIDTNILAAAYYRAKDWPRLISLWKRRADAPSASIQAWFSLAAVYYQSGDKENAVKTINAAVALHPEAAASGAAAIAEIEGKTPGK